jgi:hypothetical protein
LYESNTFNRLVTMSCCCAMCSRTFKAPPFQPPPLLPRLRLRHHQQRVPSHLIRSPAPHRRPLVLSARTDRLAAPAASSSVQHRPWNSDRAKGRSEKGDGREWSKGCTGHWQRGLCQIHDSVTEVSVPILHCDAAIATLFSRILAV